MSLQSIMDATPIVSWSRELSDDPYFTGSAINCSYGLFILDNKYHLKYFKYGWEEVKRFKSYEPQEIINKINELEGIENAKPTQAR